MKLGFSFPEVTRRVPPGAHWSGTRHRATGCHADYYRLKRQNATFSGLPAEIHSSTLPQPKKKGTKRRRWWLIRCCWAKARRTRWPRRPKPSFARRSAKAACRTSFPDLLGRDSYLGPIDPDAFPCAPMHPRKPGRRRIRKHASGGPATVLVERDSHVLGRDSRLVPAQAGIPACKCPETTPASVGARAAARRDRTSIRVHPLTRLRRGH